MEAGWGAGGLTWLLLVQAVYIGLFVHSTTFKRTFLGPSTALGHGEIPVPKTDR